MVGPEDMRCVGQPFGGVAFVGLDKGLANCLMLSLDDAICVGIVWGDADVVNTIPVKAAAGLGCFGSLLDAYAGLTLVQCVSKTC